MARTDDRRDGVARDLLLLAVGERAAFRTRGDVRPAIAAGVLAEEVLTGSRPPEAVGSASGAERWLENSSGPAFDRTVAAAQADGLVAPLVHKVLGLFPRRGYQVVDPAAQAAARRRLLGALDTTTDPVRTAPADAVLAALASVSGLARLHVDLTSKEEREAYRRHLQALVAAAGPELTAVVGGLRRTYRRLGAADGDGGTVVVVPADDRDGYGDAGGAGDAGGGDGDGGGGD